MSIISCHEDNSWKISKDAVTKINKIYRTSMHVKGKIKREDRDRKKLNHPFQTFRCAGYKVLAPTFLQPNQYSMGDEVNTTKTPSLPWIFCQCPIKAGSI